MNEISSKELGLYLFSSSLKRAKSIYESLLDEKLNLSKIKREDIDQLEILRGVMWSALHCLNVDKKFEKTAHYYLGQYINVMLSGLKETEIVD